MTHGVLPFACGSPRDGSSTARCTRERNHDGVHRGPVFGTGGLTSWSDLGDGMTWEAEQHDMPGTREPLDETRETWTDDQGWTYGYGGTLPRNAELAYRPPVDPLAGFWHVVAIIGGPALWSAAVLAATIAPAVVIVLWRMAL